MVMQALSGWRARCFPVRAAVLCDLATSRVWHRGGEEVEPSMAACAIWPAESRAGPAEGRSSSFIQASNQDLPAIADLCAIGQSRWAQMMPRSSSGQPRKGLEWLSWSANSPWLMVSLSDGSDAHFRKAWFDPQRCPEECSRPCQRVCPADAIPSSGGIEAGSCYGCGRCLPACPLGLIEERDHRIGLDAMVDLLKEIRPDAVEVHTAPGRGEAFSDPLAPLCGQGSPAAPGGELRTGGSRSHSGRSQPRALAATCLSSASSVSSPLAT